MIGCRFLVWLVLWLVAAMAFHGEAEAACLKVPGDVTLSGTTTVTDVQCVILTTLWELDPSASALPLCLPSTKLVADVDCNGTVNVADVINVIQLTLGAPLALELDFDQDGCTNVCENTCPEWSCIDNAACPSAGPCFSKHLGKGCSSAECCRLVCLKSPLCCTKSWGFGCDSNATSICGFAQCAEAINACDGTPASCIYGGPDGTCFDNHAQPACDFRNCCNSVCIDDPLCCTVAWDQTCANEAETKCGSAALAACGGEGSCFLAHAGKGCSQLTVCKDVCYYNNPSCCTTEWTSECAALANQLWSDADCPGNYSCFSTHGTSQPGCNSSGCCNTVCAIDPYCCNVTWDTICKNKAVTLCTQPVCAAGPTGSCYYTHKSPGCNESTCCNKVCVEDPYCCDVQWDSTCADLAMAVCGNPLCPQPGSCLSPHGNPGCASEECCSAVCDAQPLCCTSNWNALCASVAAQLCSVPTCPGIGDCFAKKTTPGCNDAKCCNDVCAQDSFCCTVQWDGKCVQAAVGVCTEFSLCDGASKIDLDGCYYPHSSKGCNIVSCCVEVCETDPFCCNVSWDNLCVDEAIDLCCSPACTDWDADPKGSVLLECGSDGCGGVCGYCDWNETCFNGLCGPIVDSELQIYNCNGGYDPVVGPFCSKLSTDFCGDVAPVGIVKSGSGTSASLRLYLKWCPHSAADDPDCEPGTWRNPDPAQQAPVYVDLYSAGILLKKVPVKEVATNQETLCKTATDCESFIGGVVQVPAMVGSVSVEYLRVKVKAGDNPP